MMKCPSCQQPRDSHRLLGVVINTSAWHDITEGRVMPSEVWPGRGQIMKHNAEVLWSKRGKILRRRLDTGRRSA